MLIQNWLEVLGIILAGPTPEVRSGLNAIVDFIENDASFYSANEDDTIAYYAHCVSRTEAIFLRQLVWRKEKHGLSNSSQLKLYICFRCSD